MLSQYLPVFWLNSAKFCRILKRFCLWCVHAIGNATLFTTCWAMIWGACKTYMGGGKRTRERALPKKCWTPPKELLLSAHSCIFVQEKQSNDARGGWKSYRRRGVQNPFLGGVSFVRFSCPPPPPFSTPPWRPLNMDVHTSGASPTSPPKQQNDRVPFEFLLKGHQNCERSTTIANKLSENKFRTNRIMIRKLEKAVAVSGISSGVPKENCGKSAGKMLERTGCCSNRTQKIGPIKLLQSQDLFSQRCLWLQTFGSKMRISAEWRCSCEPSPCF